jgi:hypothetical protein
MMLMVCLLGICRRHPTPDFLRQQMNVRQTFEPNVAIWAAQPPGDVDSSIIERAKGSIRDFNAADALLHRPIPKGRQYECPATMDSIILSVLLSSVRPTWYLATKVALWANNRSLQL